MTTERYNAPKRKIHFKFEKSEQHESLNRAATTLTDIRTIEISTNI